ncbi:MAG: formimidoylglutamate deiminase, partial [Phycisphaerae bacterium]|nr:formimidoylglutamate deiminase [Phycisphaerae bacterium]
MNTIMRPALTWIDGDFQSGIEIEVRDSHILDVRTTEQSPTDSSLALLPGFVNAHSHAFQRGLRGRGEVFTNPDDDFWSWRKAMYG